ncbi:metallopeptidase family protein [Solirubrobacter sp. CPCC 204708]|uniref:Metallopeptidase family protein n=1 Tax=Solirubrobacter deserti TaxID=2282478 RepID=A0ABT4RKW1_9ACTN|nr:metallopeptidase family protein [Solirubrobacter deserti]MBE2319121.1 metallopeptidase family protein [Solirubrobacter deserti]MDA0139199.1 metallopeptidase family protein [Solirubrobacter deserti]
MLSRWPAGRRLALSLVLCLALALSFAALTQGLSQQGWLRALEVIALVISAGALAAIVIGLIVSRLANYQDPESEAEFERIVIRSERLARENLAAEPDEGEFMELDPFNPVDFETLVQEALDDLPDLLIKALERVPVVISDKGRKARAYGLYQGDTVARDNYHDRIIIFRDTLLRDFGHDPDLLRDQVTRTVRHELAHHLGADELGVRELGL